MRAITIVFVFCIGIVSPVGFRQLPAQGSKASDQESVVADRFLQVLMRRPRPGTALDRVYGFHVQNGSLDELIASLEVADNAENVGEKTMIIGLIQSQRGKPLLAADAFERGERLLPDDAAVSYYLGRAQLAVGQTEKAAASIERAIEKQPARNEALPIFTELGRIYGRAGLSDKALGVWKKLEALFPGDARVGGQIARTLAEEGNVQEALQRYANLAKSARDEEDKIAFAVQAAEMRRRLGQSDEATRELEAILARLRPGSWLYTDVRNRIEDGFLKSGDFDALADYYKKQLLESEDNLQLRVRLGRILVAAGRLEEAKQSLEQSVQRAPDDPEVRLALIDLLVKTGDVGAAAKQYEKLAQQDPKNPDYLLRWGQILLDDSRVEAAQRAVAAAEVWNKLAVVRSDDAVTLAQIADRMRSIKRSEDAIKLYRQAIEVDPQSSQYREYLGEYLHQLDRKDEAIEVWQAIAEGDRRNRDSLVRLAEVFGTFELNERSLGAWREASQLDLNFPQELRFANRLRDAELHDEALQRLDLAQKLAETAEEQDQLLKDRIATYQQAGTLAEKIAELREAEPNAVNLRQLAMMHQAAGQLTDAAAAISKAISAEPENVDVLILAADIAERQSRLADAVELFQKLALLDTRFRTNYLQRVADLQMRLGQVNDALATCDSLIDANPASPETYQFYARLAFRAARDEQAVASLRRAMNVAPRDNAPRRMLASSFAGQYRTDEAIELYWQAMQYESKPDDRLALIRQLAPLYDRKGEMDVLIGRIEKVGREEGDVRGTQLMIAAAHESARDFGSARQAIDRLLAEQPRDVALLEAMVRLCDLADEVDLAAEFQDRIVKLADTPENRFKLIQLQLDADLIDVRTALSERIALAADPIRLASIIRSATARGDSDTAITICREALRHDPDLWSVKLYLAQLLLHADGDDSEKLYAEANDLCDELRAMNVPLNAIPVTVNQASPQQSTRASRPADPTSPAYWSRSGYDLARAYQIGRYGSSAFSSSYSFSQRSALIEPFSFGHARAMAACLQMIAAANGKTGTELKQTIQQLQSEKFGIPPVDQITDAGVISQYRALSSFSRLMLSTRAGTPTTSAEERELQQRLSWRLAELEPVVGSASLMSMLAGRFERASLSDSQNEPTPPLSDDQLNLLIELFEKAEAEANQKSTTTPRSQATRYRMVVFNELNRAGKQEQAQKYALLPPEDDAKVSEVLQAIAYYLRFNQIAQADALVDRLMPAVRRETGGGSSVSSAGPYGSSGGLASIGKAGADFVDRHRLKLIDALLAQAISSTAGSRGRAAVNSSGTLNTYMPMGGGSYGVMQIRAPLSTALMHQAVVTELGALMPSESLVDPNQNRKLKVPPEIIAHLETPLPHATPLENKSRQVLAAYAHWWAGEPAGCYQGLIKLCEQYPDDVDLQIERARLASELQQPRVALDALDSFDPLDSQMLIRKEMAAMNLAAQLGDVPRAKRAAERLFGMRMDTDTQLALADQLRRLGMNDKASAVLSRLRGGRSRSESAELQIANAFLANGEQAPAAEVAYTLLRRVSSGRGRSASSIRNMESYRRQAVSILRSAGRLDGLIELAERRVASSPKSSRARIELAELYTAAGRPADADKLWGDIATSGSQDPRQMLARASALYRAKKYREAALMYLDAFEKQPQLFRNHYYEMTRAVSRARMSDEMFERLTKFSPAAIPVYRLDSLLRVGGSRSFNDAKRKFLAHACKNSQVSSGIFDAIRSFPAAELAKIPEVRKAMVEAVCGEDAFSPTSGLWRVARRSGGGTAIGPLTQLIDLLVEDAETGQRFADAAGEAMKNEQSRPTAEFLIALLKLKADDQKVDAVNTIRELVLPKDEEKQHAGPAGTTSISGGLLWQAGQIIEGITGIDDRPSLLVAIYEAASRDPASGSSGDFRYSVSTRLVDAYIKNGQTKIARRFLLKAYNNTDHSQDNQYNPGYGDSQEIEAYRSIGDKLTAIGFPIDALAIYRRVIADPGKFERAKRYSNSQSVEKFEQAAAAAVTKINPNAAIAYMQFVGDESNDPKSAVKLMDLPTDSLLGGEWKSGIQLAVDAAASSDSGRLALDDFSKRMQTQASEESSDWFAPAAQIVVAAKIDPDQIPALAATLQERVPPIEQIATASDKSMYRGLLDLYTPAAAAIGCEQPGARSAGRDLAAYLRKVAKAVGDAQLGLALASLTGDSAAALDEFIEAIEASVKPGSPLPRPQLKTCLVVAKTAAASGEISLSTRAFKLALGGGPPLRPFGSAGGDAFAITRSRSGQPAAPDAGLKNVIEQANEIIDFYSDATGEQLGARAPKKKDRKTEPADQEEAMKKIADTLQAIVLPENHGASVFPYAKEIVSKTGEDFMIRSNDPIVPRSVAIALGRTASLSGQSDQVIELIRARTEKSADKATAAGVLVDVAFAAQNEEALSQAIDRFAAAMNEGSRLPARDPKAAAAPQLTTITAQMQQDYFRKSETVDLVMRTIWPLMEDSATVQPEIRKKATDLLARTAQLINSDGYISSRHRQIAERIRKVMRDAAAGVND